MKVGPLNKGQGHIKILFSISFLVHKAQWENKKVVEKMYFSTIFIPEFDLDLKNEEWVLVNLWD